MNTDILHLCKGRLLKHNRNEFESVLVRCMNLEPIIQSEVSQKNGTDFVEKEWRLRHREQTCGHNRRRKWDELRK